MKFSQAENSFFELIQVPLGTRDRLSAAPSAADWSRIYALAQEQAVAGICLAGLDRLPAEQRPPKALLLQWIGESELIRKRSGRMDAAVAALCAELSSMNIRFLVFKGQTLAVLYPDPSLRQSGDIDFLIHPDDWPRALEWANAIPVKEDWEDNTTEKDVEFTLNGVRYEMHRMLTSLSTRSHRNYWENTVVPEIWASTQVVEVPGCAVPTLGPVMNNLYVFVHIFEHLISDGIGLRQFVDWAVLLSSRRLQEEEVAQLEKHLDGLGLRSAYSGLGAVLTDYLGLPEDRFSFTIGPAEHKSAPKLMANILKMGNFGHNRQYTRNSGALHGVQHLGRIFRQSVLFGHYAPAEAWGKIPYMFRWWGQKIKKAKNQI
ncbi:MAG: nucleotidyltransferase family protein [Bacteroidales bacterium]|nr:nucleotidyltransferase family protein [Bacteroidales bacterium]